MPIDGGVTLNPLFSPRRGISQLTPECLVDRHAQELDLLLETEVVKP